MLKSNMPTMMESLISDYMLQVSGAGVVDHSRILAFVTLTPQLRQKTITNARKQNIVYTRSL